MQAIKPFKELKRKRGIFDTCDMIDYYGRNGAPLPERDRSEFCTEVDRMIFLEWEKDKYKK